MLNFFSLFRVSGDALSRTDTAASGKPAAVIKSVSRIIGTLMLGSTLMLGVSGCGQKGALVLPERDSQAMIESSSQPQDAAFERVDDAAYQKARYLEQQQLLADIDADPNDY